jgi:Arc/MetJ-type ribon-helix-helix transcriptional regulator
MPTQHKRVSVTLTPPLQQARERLLRRGLRPSVGDLALAGAEALLADADARTEHERERALLRRRLAARMRSGAGIDADALTEVREVGWTRA